MSGDAARRVAQALATMSTVHTAVLCRDIKHGLEGTCCCDSVARLINSSEQVLMYLPYCYQGFELGSLYGTAQ